MEAIGTKKSKKIPRKGDQIREFQLLVKHVILSKYLINKRNTHIPECTNPESQNSQ